MCVSVRGVGSDGGDDGDVGDGHGGDGDFVHALLHFLSNIHLHTPTHT
jgi:hypothetical protein